MSKLTKVMLVIILAGVFIGAMGVADSAKLLKGEIDDIDEVEVGSLSAGQMIEGKIYDAYDVIAVEETTQTYGFVPVSKTETPYYLVELENCYVVIDVTAAKQKDAFEKLMDETWDFLDEKTDEAPAPLKVSTKAIKMPSEVKGYLKEYCNEWGMSEGDYNKYVEDTYCLQTIVYKNTKLIPFIGFGIALLGAVILIIKKAATPRVVNL